MNHTIPERKDTDPRFHWHIEDYFKTDADWEAAYVSLEESLPELTAFAGKLADSAETLLSCLKKNDTLSLKLDHIYTYASMRMHEDSANAFYQGLASRAELLLIRYSAAVSFLTPEIIAIPEEKLTVFRAEKAADFAVYDHFFHTLLRQKAHTLSPAEEHLLARTAELGGAPQQIFTMLNDADITFPPIRTAAGEELELTKGRYVTFLESPDRSVREQAFKNLYSVYSAQKNTIAATYAASVKSDVFFAQARKYGSAMEMALSDDNIPLSVYDTLIETVNKSLPLLHRYVSLRKKELGVDELHMYDLYVPLVPDADVKIPYEQAKVTVKEALQVMGEEYCKALAHGMESGWIDVYENKGKRGGAYSWGSYGVHPFVLLNHNDTINSMFTLAHEMGHALHSFFTWKKQPYLYADHKIFVAEVASTCNEALLMEHLLKTTEDKTMRKYLINYFLEQFRGTLFRQTMFAEFEWETHKMCRDGIPLTADALCSLYHGLNEKYFGPDMCVDPEIDVEWARIPHFYYTFYVYQYATAFAAAVTIGQRIFDGDKNALEGYFNFLKGGSSMKPTELLKLCGLDMEGPGVVNAALDVFESLLGSLE